MSNQTGHYDRDDQAAKLTAANADRNARDPFATVPARPASDRQASEFVHDMADVHKAERAALAPAPAAEAPAPAPVVLFKADWPYPELSAADFAALYQAAAEVIEGRGYYEYEVQGYDDTPGLSITGGLKAAALAYCQKRDPSDSAGQHYIDALAITEELETRLSAVLYVLGQVHSRTGIRDLSDQHVGWALGHFDTKPNPGKAEALALLEQAVTWFRQLAEQAAPVTEAPAPGRM